MTNYGERIFVSSEYDELGLLNLKKELNEWKKASLDLCLNR